MNKKAILAIVLAAVIIIGAGVGFTLNRNKIKDNTTTTQPVSVSQESTSQGDTTTENTETEKSSTTETTTEAKNPYPFLYQGYWYFYNDEATSAIAIQFSGDDDVNIAYFDEYNVMGEDPKYFKGDADYKIIDGKIVIDDLPDVAGIESFILDIDGETLKYGETELEHFDDLSLEHAYNHFN